MASDIGKIETEAQFLAMKPEGVAGVLATAIKHFKNIFYCKESINLPNAFCPSVVCLKTPASSKPRSKISPTF